MLFISNWFLISQTRSKQKEGEVRGLIILPWTDSTFFNLRIWDFRDSLISFISRYRRRSFVKRTAKRTSTDARIELHPRQPNSKSFKSLTHPYLLVLNFHYRLLKTQVSRKDNNSFLYFLWLKAPIYSATSLPCCWKKCNKCKHEGHFPPVCKQLSAEGSQVAAVEYETSSNHKLHTHFVSVEVG